MIVVAAKMLVNPGVRDQFEVAAGELSRLTRNEDGCDFYDCYQSLDNADSYLLYSEWRDAHVLEAHTQTVHVLEFFKVTRDLVAESTIQIHTVAETRLVQV